MARTALMIFALASGLWGAWIPIKAQVAQLLIQRAWDARTSSSAPRPWPWADTEPVGELRFEGERWIVLAGATGRTLAFGPGHVDGTARPGERGRVAIAGHRDTHFRFLEQLRVGQELELVDREGRTHRYAVRLTRVVSKDDAHWLRGPDGLVLVTCYPFDAVAPGGDLRFIVWAVPTEDRETDEPRLAERGATPHRRAARSSL